MRTRDFIKAHPVGGWCKVPEKADKTPVLKFGKLDVPEYCDNRNYCTAIEDQGNLPHCAAYTAAAFAENILWRRDGRIQQIEPLPLYKWAKAHDGDPNGSGTTLNCAAEALLAQGVFNPKVCKIKSVGRAWVGVDVQDVKATIHRFGCFLGGFGITTEWYKLNNGAKPCITGEEANALGGHAVLVCGYTADGVWIENSWGAKWGNKGFGFLTWGAFEKQYLYGIAITNCLDGFK